MRCPRCGSKIRKNDMYCSRCGRALENGAGRPYTDSFLRPREEGSRALFVTVMTLIVIAAVTALILLFYHHPEWKDFLTGGQEKMSEDIVVIDLSGNGEGSASEEAKTGEVSEGTPSGVSGGEAVSEAETPETGQTEETEETEESEDDTGGLSMKHVQELMDSLSSGVSDYGVYVYDLLKNREYLTENADKPMYLSACISVPILYSAAHLLDGSVITLNDTIVYENSIGGRGEAYPENRAGSPLPLSYYLTTMLTYSDNNCMNSLMGYIGRESINQICQSAGFSSVDLQRSIVADVTDGAENYASARDVGQMVKQLYNGKFKIIGRSFLENYMKLNEYDIVPSYIKEGCAGFAPNLFLNQNGKGDTRYSETAVVSCGGNNFVIAVMVKGEMGFDCSGGVKSAVEYICTALGEQAGQ